MGISPPFALVKYVCNLMLERIYATLEPNFRPCHAGTRESNDEKLRLGNCGYSATVHATKTF